MKRLVGPLVAFALIALGAGAARADIIAAYLQGEGGLSSASADNGNRTGSPSSGNAGLGLQLGARILIFEGYVDYDNFGDGAAVSRGIIGLRGGFGTSGLRLVLRGGVGGLAEQGGALTARMPGVPDRHGFVARAGASLEAKVATALWAGIGLDSEAFTIATTTGGSLSNNAVHGTDLFATFRLLFEIGI
jgi:hypothetical protein